MLIIDSYTNALCFLTAQSMQKFSQTQRVTLADNPFSKC